MSLQSGEGGGPPPPPVAARRRPPGVGGGVRRGGRAGRGDLGDRHDRARHGHEASRSGVVLGVALSPLAADVQRALRSLAHRRRPAIVGGGRGAVLRGRGPAGGPAGRASRRSDFSDELPATVRELYSWPIVGDRLEEADAAGEVEEAIEDLPARIDDQTLAELGERLLGGALLHRRRGDRRHRRAGRRRGDRPPASERVVPPSRQARADEMGRIVYHSFGSYFAGSLLVAVLNGLFVLTVGLLLGVPLAPIAAHLGDAHQPHPADRRVPRRRVLRAARPHPEPHRRP